MNETSFNLRMPKDLKTSLEELARKDGRSLNNLINKVLTDYASKNYFPCGSCKCYEDGKCIILDAEVDQRTRDQRCPLGKEKDK